MPLDPATLRAYLSSPDFPWDCITLLSSVGLIGVILWVVFSP